jgi:hypothetical protein
MDHQMSRLKMETIATGSAERSGDPLLSSKPNKSGVSVAVVALKTSYKSVK